MSVYKPQGSPYYHFDFQWRGDRFHGSTKRTDRREAQAVEKAERERVKHTAAPATSAGMTLDNAAGRYWPRSASTSVVLMIPSAIWPASSTTSVLPGRLTQSLAMTWRSWSHGVEATRCRTLAA